MNGNDEEKACAHARVEGEGEKASPPPRIRLSFHTSFPHPRSLYSTIKAAEKEKEEIVTTNKQKQRGRNSKR